VVNRSFSHIGPNRVYFFINDLIKEDGSLLSLTDLKNNYNINIIFSDYYSIMLLIPQEWKSILRDNQIEKLDELCNKHILLLRVSQRVVKPFYKIFIQKVFEKPLKSQNKWMTDLNITEEENWDIIYQLPFKSILSTKLQSFQYKLNLRILYTNSMLMKCGLSRHNYVVIVLKQKNRFVRSLWLQLTDNLRSKCGINININPVECTLGLLFDPNCEILNTCLIIIRYYIYVCRIKREMINWTGCLETLNYYRNIDLKSLCICTPRQAQIIKRKWELMKNIFQSDEYNIYIIFFLLLFVSVLEIIKKNVYKYVCMITENIMSNFIAFDQNKIIKEKIKISFLNHRMVHVSLL
jgi:hypothetical protein